MNQYLLNFYPSNEMLISLEVKRKICCQVKPKVVENSTTVSLPIEV